MNDPIPTPASTPPGTESAITTETDSSTVNAAVSLRAEALRDAVFDSGHFSGMATDDAGVIRIFGVGAERMLGYVAAEVVGRLTPADLSEPAELAARSESLSQEVGRTVPPGFETLVFKASRDIEDIYELTYLRKDGTRLPALVSTKALRDSSGSIIGYLIVGTDNSSRKLAEEERTKLDQRLRDQQFYTRSLIEANIDAIMTTDVQGIVTDANRQMEALSGCTRDELVGSPFKGFFTDPDRAEAGIRQILSEGTLANYELTARSWEGLETVVSCNASTFYDRDRRLQGVFVAARDVTQRKRLDQVLKERNMDLQVAKAVAEKANLSKSEFLSSMSHELRSPLNAILGFAQLLESESPPPTPGQQESIGRILQAGWHLLNLINEILDLARIEAGKYSLSPEPVRLEEVLGECRELVEGQAQKREVDLAFPSLEERTFVHADRTRLKQVLLNLLSNAIKYNRTGGTAWVSHHMTESDMLRVVVGDTGEGLSPEEILQLFQPFNRLGKEASSEEGTGIGLVVAKQLVEMMSGKIGVESEIGTGSRFWFELPPGTEDSRPSASPSPTSSVRKDPAPRPGSRTLLYVEDNPANLSLVEQLVARRPELDLSTAVTGGLGIEIARSRLPDLILMDINLPDMSGIEVLHVLKRDPTTSHIPIVAISANAMPHDIARGLKAGFFLYLTKPIKIAEFNSSIDAALEFAGKRPIHPSAQEASA